MMNPNKAKLSLLPRILLYITIVLLGVILLVFFKPNPLYLTKTESLKFLASQKYSLSDYDIRSIIDYRGGRKLPVTDGDHTEYGYLLFTYRTAEGEFLNACAEIEIVERGEFINGKYMYVAISAKITSVPEIVPNDIDTFKEYDKWKKRVPASSSIILLPRFYVKPAI